MGICKMKIKNSLAVIAGSLIAVTSLSAVAQGQGSIEVEGFAKRYFTDSARHMGNGQLYGGSLGYFLTDNVELALSYGEYHDIRTEHQYGHKNIKGSLTSVDAYYHFGEPGSLIRPYISAGGAHQSIGQVKNGRNRNTLVNLGLGAKLYVTDNLFLRAGVEGMHGLASNHQSEWALVGALGANFGGSPKPVPAPEPEIVIEEVTPEPEIVRVELNVRFNFDKDTIHKDSYQDIKDLADFMKQFPQTTTVVKGYTDSTGPEAYNQKLSERRANAVRNAIVDEYGIAADRVSAVGYGEADPVADNSTKEGRAMNRRVDAEVEAQIIPAVEVNETVIEETAE